MRRIIERLMPASYLLEDKLDDWVKKYSRFIPGASPEAKRSTLLMWASMDPTYTPAVEALPAGNAGNEAPVAARPMKSKFLSWMVKQAVTGKVVWDDHSLDHIRDLLGDYVRLCAIPTFTESKDISTYDYRSFVEMVERNNHIESVSQQVRTKRAGGKKIEGATLLNTVGVYELFGFTDGVSLSNEAWLGYDHANPNWTGKNTPDDKRKPHPGGSGASDPVYKAQSHYKTDPEYNQGREPYSMDGNWCIREPQRGLYYASSSPSKMFYMIRKNGWPYVGIACGPSSQAVDTGNAQRGIGLGIAKEIYPVFKPVLDLFAEKGWNLGSAVDSLFKRLHFINAGLQAGQTLDPLDLEGLDIESLPERLTIRGNFSLRNSKVTVLPQVLTVKGDLDISGCNITEFPAGVKVSGKLNISNTGISVLPEGLTVESLDITGTPIKVLPEGLTASGDLILSNSSITVLPQVLTVRGKLDVSGCALTELPAGVKVTGKVDISNTEIAALPEGFRAASIDISGTPIASFPTDFRVELILHDQNFDTYTKMRAVITVRSEGMKALRSAKKPGMSEKEKAADWERFLPPMLKMAMTDKTMIRLMNVLFVKK